ncbi:hypothetical protein M501DRAFT_909516, partial [Patellaria atrata CBS 101060]
EDDPDTFVILLHLAHLNINCLPATLDFQHLLQLSVICDKYDTVHLVRPYESKWVDPSKKNLKAPGYEGWMFIAWVFGYQDSFKSLAQHLI